MEYEVVKYVIKFGKELKEVYTEEDAISLYEHHKDADEDACVYQVKRMIF